MTLGMKSEVHACIWYLTSNYMEIRRSLGTKLSLLDLILQYLNLHFIYFMKEGMLFKMKRNFVSNYFNS